MGKVSGQSLSYPSLDKVRQDVIEWVQLAAKGGKIKDKRVEIEIKINYYKV